jgi:hypothetical protein
VWMLDYDKHYHIDVAPLHLGVLMECPLTPKVYPVSSWSDKNRGAYLDYWGGGYADTKGNEQYASWDNIPFGNGGTKPMNDEWAKGSRRMSKDTKGKKLKIVGLVNNALSGGQRFYKAEVQDKKYKGSFINIYPNEYSQVARLNNAMHNNEVVETGCRVRQLNKTFMIAASNIIFPNKATKIERKVEGGSPMSSQRKKASDLAKEARKRRESRELRKPPVTATSSEIKMIVDASKPQEKKAGGGTPTEKLSTVNTPASFKGPWGQCNLMFLQRCFNDAGNVCSNCNKALTPNMAGTYTWLNSKACVCKVCQEDPVIQTLSREYLV